MLVKELEDLLQISSYTLRYYEKIGLIKPMRDQNGYRNYTQEDIQIIKKIIFLRELDIPIEDISDILSHEKDFQTVLENHIKKIDSQIHSLKYIQDICHDLKEKDIPLLDAVVNEEMINKEHINTNEVQNGMKKIITYLKPIKTVVIGTRVDVHNYLKSYIFVIGVSVLMGVIIGFGIPNTITNMNKNIVNVNTMNMIPFYKSGIFPFVIGSVMSFIIIVIIMARKYGKQKYIELTDHDVSICSQEFQSRLSILMGMIYKDARKRNKTFGYDEIDKVSIELVFSTTSGGYSGVWRTYILNFEFFFHDGTHFEIIGGKLFG